MKKLYFGTLIVIVLLIVSAKNTVYAISNDKVREQTTQDSLLLKIYSQLDTEEMRKKRIDFGDNFEKEKYKAYRLNKLSKKAKKYWLLHMEAVYGVIMEEHDKKTFIRSKRTMYSLDTLEHRIISLEKAMSDRSLQKDSVFMKICSPLLQYKQ